MDKRKFNKGHIKGVPSGKKGKTYTDKTSLFKVLVNNTDKKALIRFAFQQRIISEINFKKRMASCEKAQKSEIK